MPKKQSTSNEEQLSYWDNVILSYWQRFQELILITEFKKVSKYVNLFTGKEIKSSNKKRKRK